MKRAWLSKSKNGRETGRPYNWAFAGEAASSPARNRAAAMTWPMPRAVRQVVPSLIAEDPRESTRPTKALHRFQLDSAVAFGILTTTQKAGRVDASQKPAAA